MTAHRTLGLAALIVAQCVGLTGCITAQGGSPIEKRADAQSMRSDALNTFYSRVPAMRGQLEKAAGYGVFSSLSTHAIVLTTGNGFGIIRDNATGKDTYMRALKLGGGLGVGAETVRAVVVFHDPAVMRGVLEHGWGVSGRAEAAAKVEQTGDSKTMVVTLPGMSIYRFSSTGVMLGGAIEGTKVWADEELNR